VNQDLHKPSLQFVRYLLVGGFNTVFGYGLFAFLNWTFSGLGSYGYMYAWALASVISLTVAFLGYKWFVFRTHGNYIVEWMRCFGVYGTTMIIGAVSLPILVTILRRVLHRPERAPYVAAGMIAVVTVVISFLGHKNISFRNQDVKKVGSNPEIPSA
jgi:putative flippase GtrA